MKKKDIITLGILIVLTIVTAIFATTWHSIKNVAIIILLISIVKFLLVAFQFMELKKAHRFWKVLIIIYLSIFLLIMTIVI